MFITMTRSPPGSSITGKETTAFPPWTNSERADSRLVFEAGRYVLFVDDSLVISKLYAKQSTNIASTLAQLLSMRNYRFSGTVDMRSY